MKLFLDQRGPLRITQESQESSALVKENSHLFNHLDKLAADHNVTVSNTMIKVTYKKTLKDHLDNEVNNCDETVLNKTMNTDLNSNDKPETVILCNSDKSHTDKSMRKNSQVFHSIQKETRQLVNGINLNVTGPESDNITSEVTKSDIMFLKNSIMKSKQSVKSRNKKLCIGDKHNQKFKKLKNGLKAKRIEEMKRKVEEEAHNSKKFKVGDEKEEAEKRDENETLMSRSKKPILLEDPDLPPGWTRFIRTKNKGTANEQHVVYVVNPQGKKFRFKWKLRKFLAKTNSPLDADQFFFGLYKRSKPVIEKDEKDSEDAPETPNVSETQNDTSTHSMSEGVVDEKGVLLVDPDLPFGWKRNVHYNNSTGRREVLIISPEGRIFRRRYRLHEYLIKHQYTHNLDRFHFGLYPKKEGNYSCLNPEKDGDYLQSKNQYLNNKYEELKKKYLSIIGNREIGIILKKIDAEPHSSRINHDESYSDHENDAGEFASEKDERNGPMYDDPSLPEGWKRFIKVRGCGESAGRMEVVIVSPDGRRHRNKKHLECYLSQKNLDFKPEDFDFSVFGRANIKKRPPQLPLPATPKPETDSNDLMFVGMKKKFSDKPVPELDIESLKEPKITHEGRLINEVNGLMISSGLSSARSERRHKLPRNMQQKRLKSYLEEEGEVSSEGKDIPTWWIQRLMKCRSDFRDLEPDAAVVVAERTKEFVKELSVRALGVSENPEKELTYEDVAKVVDQTETLSPLKTLIPKKITYREFIQLNRPKQFMSFT